MSRGRVSNDARCPSSIPCTPGLQAPRRVIRGTHRAAVLAIRSTASMGRAITSATPPFPSSRSDVGAPRRLETASDATHLAHEAHRLWAVPNAAGLVDLQQPVRSPHRGMASQARNPQLPPHLICPGGLGTQNVKTIPSPLLATSRSSRALAGSQQACPSDPAGVSSHQPLRSLESADPTAG
jgi:hypothetical protein